MRTEELGLRNIFKIMDKIDKQHQHYWEFVYANNRSLKQVNSAVSRVDIEYTVHWFDLPTRKKSHQFTLSPDSSVIVLEDCPNEHCTSNGFDLSNILKTMLAQNRTEETGSIKCDRCPAKLDYSIKIVYSG